MKVKIKILYSKELDLTLLVDYEYPCIVYKELQGSYAIFYIYANCKYVYTNHKQELSRLCADSGLDIKYIWENTALDYNNHNFYITGDL